MTSAVLYTTSSVRSSSSLGHAGKRRGAQSHRFRRSAVCARTHFHAARQRDRGNCLRLAGDRVRGSGNRGADYRGRIGAFFTREEGRPGRRIGPRPGGRGLSCFAGTAKLRGPAAIFFLARDCRALRGIHAERELACAARKQRTEQKGSPAQSFDQDFLFFFSKPGQGVERGEVTSDSGRGQKEEGFGGKPKIAGPVSGEKYYRGNATHQNLRTKRNQRGHAGLTLAAHLAEFHLAWKGDRGPVRNRELPHDGENDGGAGSHQHVGRRQADAPGEHGQRKRDFHREHGDEHQILAEKYIAETQRRGEVGLNAAAFIGKAVVGRRHQNQDEVGHHAGEKHLCGDAPAAHSRVPSGKIHAEDQYQQRGHQQAEIRKTVASEVAKLFANDRSHGGRKQTQAIGTVVFPCDRTAGGAGRRRGFAELFAAILRGKAAPQERAEQKQVKQEKSGTQQKSRWLQAGNCGQGAARKRRRKPCQVGQEAQECRPGRRTVTLHQGRKKIQRNHGENK